MDTKVREGLLTFDNVSDSKSIRRFVERQIRGWLSLHVPGPQELKDVSYTAAFRQEGDRTVVACDLDVKFGKEHWHGSWYARNVHQALLQCLGHLSQMRSLPRQRA